LTHTVDDTIRYGIRCTDCTRKLADRDVDYSQTWAWGLKPPKFLVSPSNRVQPLCNMATSNQIKELTRRPLSLLLYPVKNANNPLRDMRAACRGFNALL